MSDANHLVVTGASGFLGRNLMLEIKKSGLKALPVSRTKLEGGYKVSDYKNTPGGKVLIHLGCLGKHRVS